MFVRRIAYITAACLLLISGVSDAQTVAVAQISSEAEKYCTEIYDQAVQMGPYTPYGMVPSISFPGSTGGGSNDGGSFDPVRGTKATGIRRT